MRIRISLVAMFAALALLIPTSNAWACSCAGIADLKAAVAQADGAVVGTVVTVDDSAPKDLRVTTIQVQAATAGISGPTVKVESSKQGSACGLESQADRVVGLLLHETEAGWGSSLCETVSPKLLSKALAPVAESLSPPPRQMPGANVPTSARWPMFFVAAAVIAGLAFALVAVLRRRAS